MKMPSSPIGPFIFTFDIGTSSLRTTLVDGCGRRLVETTAQESYRLRVTPDGGAELSPAILKRAAQRCIARHSRRACAGPDCGGGRIVLLAQPHWHG